jgi:hypothetical protein
VVDQYSFRRKKSAHFRDQFYGAGFYNYRGRFSRLVLRALFAFLKQATTLGIPCWDKISRPHSYSLFGGRRRRYPYPGHAVRGIGLFLSSTLHNTSSDPLHSAVLRSSPCEVPGQGDQMSFWKCCQKPISCQNQSITFSMDIFGVTTLLVARYINHDRRICSSLHIRYV